MKLTKQFYMLIISIVSLQNNYLPAMDNSQQADSFVNLEHFNQDTYFALLPADLTVIIIKLLSSESSNLVPYCEKHSLDHQNSVDTAFFNQGGDRIITKGRAFLNNTILWTHDGNRVATLVGHNAPICFVEFDTMGQKIVTASRDRTAKVWTKEGALLVTLKGHEEAVECALFNYTDDKIVTTSADKTAKIWSVDGKLITTLTGHEAGVYVARFSHANDKIITGSGDRTAKIWTVDGKLLVTLAGHQGNIHSVQFNPTDDKIVTASYDNTAKLWNCEGQLLATLTRHTSPVQSAMFDSTGEKIMTCSSEGTAALWTNTGNLLTVLGGLYNPAERATYNHSGNKIVAAFYPDTAKIYTADGTLLATLKHNAKVNSAVFSMCGNSIVTASDDKKARIWQRPVLDLSLPEIIALRAILKKDGVTIFQEAKKLSGPESISFSEALRRLIRNYVRNNQK